MAQKKRILLAEDEAPIGRALKIALEGAGYEVELAFNGKEALDRAEKGMFDLIMLDLIMPVMSGFAALEALKLRGNTVPVVVNSNLNQPDEKIWAESFGAKAYFVKSDMPLAEIVRRVSGILSE